MGEGMNLDMSKVFTEEYVNFKSVPFFGRLHEEYAKRAKSSVYSAIREIEEKQDEN